MPCGAVGVGRLHQDSVYARFESHIRGVDAARTGGGVWPLSTFALRGVPPSGDIHTPQTNSSVALCVFAEPDCLNSDNQT